MQYRRSEFVSIIQLFLSYCGSNLSFHMEIIGVEITIILLYWVLSLLFLLRSLRCFTSSNPIKECYTHCSSFQFFKWFSLNQIWIQFNPSNQGCQEPLHTNLKLFFPSGKIQNCLPVRKFAVNKRRVWLYFYDRAILQWVCYRYFTTFYCNNR